MGIRNQQKNIPKHGWTRRHANSWVWDRQQTNLGVRLGPLRYLLALPFPVQSSYCLSLSGLLFRDTLKLIELKYTVFISASLFCSLYVWPSQLMDNFLGIQCFRMYCCLVNREDNVLDCRHSLLGSSIMFIAFLFHYWGHSVWNRPLFASTYPKRLSEPLNKNK